MKGLSSVKIIQLPERLANQIAAGEVVERPASVVKELVENSIDANSSWIKVEIKEAGLEQIKIIDNGDGISAADCERAFLRHATSKIKSETDLFRVYTLGFRGEALASIASVSRLILKTSEGISAGTILHLEGGKIIERGKGDARKGTEIVVNDLFFNTPARLKYMKTIHTELGHITDLLTRLAFANPQIRFEVTHNGKEIFKTSGSGDLLQIISQVYGINVARNMLSVEAETIDFKINGYVAKPETTRATRSYISIIINGRYIRNNALTQAILRAYHTLLPIRRYPIVILNVQMDPYLVDVNVHPTKLEVRFSKENELVSVIEEMIRSTFQKSTLIPEMKQQSKTNHKETIQENLDFDFKKNKQHVIKEKQPFIELGRQIQNQNNNKDLNHYPTEQLSSEQSSISSQTNTKTEEHYLTEERYEPRQSESNEKSEKIPPMYLIGQFHGTYILAQNDDGLFMIDQHAAQERIKYEMFKEKLGKPIHEVQQLLIPITLEFSQKETILIEQNKEILEKIGLFFEPFGHQSYIIRSHPTWFPKGYEEDIIREMVEQVIHKESVDVEKIREASAIMMACKGSIKANEYLNEREMFQLIDDLRKTTDPFTCPHGRPIIVHFSTYEVEKMFKRIM